MFITNFSLRALCVVILAMTLNACGYKLRGSVELPNYLRTMHITPNLPYEAFQRTLRERLVNNKVNIVNNPLDNASVLEIDGPHIDRQLLAESTSGQGQRIRISFTITYTIHPHDKTATLDKRSITRTRELSKTNNMLLSNDNEEQLVTSELLNETVTELLRQLCTRPLHKEAGPDSSNGNNKQC